MPDINLIVVIIELHLTWGEILSYVVHVFFLFLKNSPYFRSRFFAEEVSLRSSFHVGNVWLLHFKHLLIINVFWIELWESTDVIMGLSPVIIVQSHLDRSNVIG